MKKFLVGISLLLVIFVMCGCSDANVARIESITQDLAGRTFTGKTEEDYGFYDLYAKGLLSEYSVYYLNTEKNTYTFNSDNTFKLTTVHDRSVLAYPKSLTKKPEGTHSEYDSNGSWKVTYSKGTFWIEFGNGYKKLSLSVNDSNHVTSMYDSQKSMYLR